MKVFTKMNSKSKGRIWEGNEEEMSNQGMKYVKCLSDNFIYLYFSISLSIRGDCSPLFKLLRTFRNKILECHVIFLFFSLHVSYIILILFVQ